MGASHGKQHFDDSRRHNFSATELQQQGVLLDIAGLPSTHFKQVRFTFSSVLCDHMEALRAVTKYKKQEIFAMDIPYRQIFALCSDGVEVLNLGGRCRLRLTNFLSFLNDQRINCPSDDSLDDLAFEENEELEDDIVIIQLRSSKSTGHESPSSRSISLNSSLPTIAEEQED